MANLSGVGTLISNLTESLSFGDTDVMVRASAGGTCYKITWANILKSIFKDVGSSFRLAPNNGTISAKNSDAKLSNDLSLKAGTYLVVSSGGLYKNNYDANFILQAGTTPLLRCAGSLGLNGTFKLATDAVVSVHCNNWGSSNIVINLSDAITYYAWTFVRIQ